MRIDKYTMAQSWMRQDDATPEEAKATWDTLEIEFEDKRKAQLMASAETDEIIKTINDKFGPGTLFPASQLPEPENPYKDFEERNPKAEGGQLVQPNADGSRPGYQGTPEKFAGKKGLEKGVHMYDSFGKALEKINLPEGYITPYEFSKKHGLPTTETGGRKKSIIGNHLQRPQRLDSPHTVNRAQVFLIKKLKPKQIMVRGQPVWVVKDDRVGGKLAKEVINYFDSTFLPEKTMNNINKILNNKKYKPIKKLFQKGDYKEIKNALMNLKEFTQAEKSNLMLRIAQGMDGRGFRDFKLNIKENKGFAKNIFKGLEKEQWGDPFGSAYRSLKRDTITAGLGDKYFTSTYGNFLQNAKKILKKNNIWVEGMDLNELTGLSSGYKNQTFGSTQFVNLMDAEFNRGDHANMLKEYGKHEARLQKALSGKRPNYDAAANEVKKWKAWKKNWFDGLDPKYKTQQIKSILPDFKITDKASKIFTKDRLDEFRKQNFPIAEEIKQKGYAKIAAKTKIARSEIPTLREIATGDTKAIERAQKQIINQLTGGDAKLNKFVSQNFMPSGLSGAYEMLSDDLKKIINSDGFKQFSNNPALKKTLAAGKLPTKLYGPLDLLLGYFDYQNNRQKGFSVVDSIAHAGDMMLFGITDFGKDADVAGVKEIALKNGMSSEVFDGLVAANKNQNEVQNLITDFAALNKQSEDLMASGMGNQSIEYGILAKKKKDSQERLKVLMAEAIEREPSLKTNLQVQEAGAPIDINVDKEKAFANLNKASAEFVQKRIDESDLENIAKQDDTTMGKIGAATKMTIGDPEWWLNLNLNQPWKKTAAMKRFTGMDQLKREDPTLYYKMLLSEGVDPNRNMNIPVRLEFEMQNPEFGTPLSSHIKSQSYFAGGIAGVKKVDPDELREAQEKMKKLMKQYKNKKLDWDAVKRSYRIWTK